MPFLGLRAISMVWFLIGSSLVLAMPFIQNLDEYQKGITEPWYMQILVNYTLTADIFFLIGGILTGYRFFMDRRTVMEGKQVNHVTSGQADSVSMCLVFDSHDAFI